MISFAQVWTICHALRFDEQFQPYVFQFFIQYIGFIPLIMDPLCIWKICTLSWFESEKFLRHRKRGKTDQVQKKMMNQEVYAHSVSSRSQMYTIESKKRRDKGSKTPLIGWRSSYDGNAPEEICIINFDTISCTPSLCLRANLDGNFSNFSGIQRTIYIEEKSCY